MLYFSGSHALCDHASVNQQIRESLKGHRRTSEGVKGYEAVKYRPGLVDNVEKNNNFQPFPSIDKEIS